MLPVHLLEQDSKEVRCRPILGGLSDVRVIPHGDRSCVSLCF